MTSYTNASLHLVWLSLCFHSGREIQAVPDLGLSSILFTLSHKQGHVNMLQWSVFAVTTYTRTLRIACY